MVIQNPENLLTTSEVAIMLNVAKNTVRKWSDAGIIESERIGSRRDRLFRKIDVERFLSKNEKS